MKLQISATLLGTALLVALSGCASKSSKTEDQGGGATFSEPAQDQGQGSQTVVVRPGQPGGMVVQTYEETATVTNIDRQTRKVTLVAPDGTQAVVKAGPAVANFDQIQVGDQVKATITEQLVILVRKSAETAPTPDTTTVALAPLGAKPGVVMANTEEITGKVTAIDLENHKATVQFPDGQSKTFRVRPDVDLSKQSVGDEVVIRSTEALAVRVEKP